MIFEMIRKEKKIIYFYVIFFVGSIGLGLFEYMCIFLFSKFVLGINLGIWFLGFLRGLSSDYGFWRFSLLFI